MESDEIQRLGNEHSPVQPLSVRQFSLKMQLGRPLQCFIAGRRLRLHPCSDGAIQEREYRSQRNLATASRRSLTGRSESTREVPRELVASLPLSGRRCCCCCISSRVAKR